MDDGYLQRRAAAFESWALCEVVCGCWATELSAVDCAVMAAKAARFCTVIWGRRPAAAAAAATAAVSVWLLRPE